jgi:hypothetical protein
LHDASYFNETVVQGIPHHNVTVVPGILSYDATVSYIGYIEGSAINRLIKYGYEMRCLVVSQNLYFPLFVLKKCLIAILITNKAVEIINAECRGNA